MAGKGYLVQQDQRIGLALAVLLIGAAGAFCFRNDPKPVGSPRLKSTKELDARIAEKSISPYLESSDEDHEHPGVIAKKITDRSIDGQPRLPAPDYFKGSQSAQGENGIQELAPIPFPDGTSPEVIANDRTAKSAATGERLHIVQKGETLSSIAAKELGSSGRFHELFEANRDQLNDANDVRVGMSLRVPVRKPTQSESSTAKARNSAPPLIPSDSDQAGELPSLGDSAGQTARPGDSSGKKKFEPAKRAPLGVKGMGATPTESEPASKPTRKLSQMPPKDGKVIH